MPSTIWNKYKLIKEISSNSGIKTYSARLEPIIKEIKPKDKDDYHAISERLEQLKAQLDIYEIIEEDNKKSGNSSKQNINSNFDNFRLNEIKSYKNEINNLKEMINKLKKENEKLKKNLKKRIVSKETQNFFKII